MDKRRRTAKTQAPPKSSRPKRPLFQGQIFSAYFQYKQFENGSINWRKRVVMRTRFRFLEYLMASTWLHVITSWFIPSPCSARNSGNSRDAASASRTKNSWGETLAFKRYRVFVEWSILHTKHFRTFSNDLDIYTLTLHSLTFILLFIILNLNMPVKSISLKPRMSASEQSPAQPLYSAHQIEVVRANRTTFTKASIIVKPTNASNVASSSSLSTQIHSAAGPELAHHIMRRKLNDLRWAQVVSTPAYHLKHLPEIFHVRYPTNGPPLHNPLHVGYLRTELYNCYKNCLNLAQVFEWKYEQKGERKRKCTRKEK